MKKIIVLLSIILLTGCHTAKIATKQTSQQTVEQQNDLTANATQAITTNQISIAQQAQTVEKTTTMVSYDTSKPIVTVTGKPPIAQEVIEKTVTHTDATGKVTTETKVQAAQSQVDKTTINKQAKSSLNQKTTPVKS